MPNFHVCVEFILAFQSCFTGPADPFVHKCHIVLINMLVYYILKYTRASSTFLYGQFLATYSFMWILG